MRQPNVMWKFQLPPEPRHGCETLPLTVNPGQKHGMVKFSGSVDVPNIVF